MEETGRREGKEAITSSSSSSSLSTEIEYEVFLSFARRDDSLFPPFVELLHRKLKDAGLLVYPGPGDIGGSKDIHSSLAIKKCRVSIAIFDKYYASSKICLDQVAMIAKLMRTRGLLVLPIFYMINESDIQNQTGPFKEYIRRYQEYDWHDAFLLALPFVAASGLSQIIVPPVNFFVPVALVVLFYLNIIKKANKVRAIKKWKKALGEIGSLKGVTVNSHMKEDKLVVQIVAQVKKLLRKSQVPYELALRSIAPAAFDRIAQTQSKREGKKAKRFSPSSTEHEYDVFLSYEGRFATEYVYSALHSFVRLLHQKLRDDRLQVYPDLENIRVSEDIDSSLPIIKKCRVSIPIIDEDYTSSKTCLDQLAMIVKCTRTRVLPLFYNINKSDVQNQMESFEKHFCQEKETVFSRIIDIVKKARRMIKSLAQRKHIRAVHKSGFRPAWQTSKLEMEKMKGVNSQVINEWKEALGEVGSLEGFRVTGYMIEELVDRIVEEVKNPSMNLRDPTDDNLVGMSSVTALERTEEKWRQVGKEAIQSSYPSSSIPTEETFKYEMEEKWRRVGKETFQSSYTSSPISVVKTFKLDVFLSLHKLKLNQLCMGRHLVGINLYMERISDLLNFEVNDVRIIAISGEDGAGKTTLAKVIYHQLSSCFEGCSFLTEIDERTRHYDGVKCLQAQMISNLLNIECENFDSVIEGINLIKERFQSMKVLIILDDVTESFQVEALVGQLVWFGPGSRIIIVTKTTNIIPLPHFKYNILANWKSSFDRSYELFCKNTFRGDNPPPNFESLSKKIVGLLFQLANSCLTIEIVGSLLCGKDQAEWEYILQKLQDREMDLNGVLTITFDRLNDIQKEIFLDISCFPNGLDQRIASSLWYDSLHFPISNDDFEQLIRLSLVKVGANNEILMHRLIKDFGREIADQKSQENMEKGEDWHVPAELPALGLELPNIRYFKLDNVIVRGNRDSVFMRQRDLIWKWCPPDLLATLNSRCLKVLDMSCSKITEDWQGWKQIKVPQLRVLNLRGCGDLMVTANFSFCPYLEILILEHCSCLVKIDPSIGELRHLKILDLRNCPELSVLPEEVGCLTTLTELSLDGTSLQEIPSSIGHLKKLRFLTAVSCFSLIHLPTSIYCLQSITVIKLDFSKITELPYSIGEKLKLHHLSLRGCRGLRRLAPLVGEVERSLVELDVSKTSISELPKSIVKLKALRVLKMDFCFIMEFPPCFGEMKSLEEIHASWCRNLKSLPNDIGELKSLRFLMLRRTCIFNLPKSIQYLDCLQILDCTSCEELQNLPRLPPSLTSLHIESKKLKEVHDYAYLKSLEEFTWVSGEIRYLPDVSTTAESTTDSLYWLQGCLSLRTLRLCLPLNTDLPVLPNSLKILRLLRCSKLKQLPPLPSTMVVLSIQDCASLIETPNVENLKNLQEMEILCCPLLEKIGGLERLQAMRVLTISGSGIKSLEGLDKLTSLMKLNICPSMREFLDLSALKCVDVHWL